MSMHTGTHILAFPRVHAHTHTNTHTHTLQIKQPDGQEKALDQVREMAFTPCSWVLWRELAADRGRTDGDPGPYTHPSRAACLLYVLHSGTPYKPASQEKAQAWRRKEGREEEKKGNACPDLSLRPFQL